MTPVQSIIIGAVEGFTEYLPVSSTGHILLAQSLMGLSETEAANAFAICVQLGAILAVLGIYFNRVKQVVLGFLGKDKTGRKLGTNLIVAFLPAAFFGALFNGYIERHLFGLSPVIFAWTVGGIAILGFTKKPLKRPGPKKNIEHIKAKDALIIGLFQCIAMWPGTSRSLVTIGGGLFRGLKKEAAIEFSFLLGGLTLFAATVYSALKHHEALTAEYGCGTLALGFLTAWFTAWISVKWMVGYLKKHDFTLFAWWRLGIAGASLLWVYFF